MPIPSWITIFSENFRPRRRTNFYYSDKINAYQLVENGETVTLKNQKGKLYSEKISENRDIIGAVKTKDGFAVLLEGTSNQLNGQYKILYANDEGTITSRTKWSPKTFLDNGRSENNFSDYSNPVAQPNTFNIALTDINSDGIVDGSESTAYQIYQDGAAITLSNRKGKTYRDQTAKNWDVTQISQAIDGDGFAVLREGANKKAGSFRVWFTNSRGVITSGTKWKSDLQLANEGFEDIFERDFNGDGYIGEASKDDYGDTRETSELITVDSFVQGELEELTDNDQFSINLTAGKTYEFSATGITLSDPYLTLYNPDGSVGRINDDYDFSTSDSRIVDFEATQSGLHYLDVKSYLERYAGTYILSATEVEPPKVDDGDATYIISGTPALGEILSLARTSDDPDGNGSDQPSFIWQKSINEGQEWTDIASTSQIAIGSNLQNALIRGKVRYIDGEEFDEVVFTQSVLIPAPPSDDYGNTPATSGTIAVNGSAQGDLENPDDHDLFSINLTAGRTYEFSATGITLSDPYLTLYDPNGFFSRMNDDHNSSTRDSKIVGFEATQSGLHYLDVNSYRELYAGTYILSATESYSPPSGFSLEDGYGLINAEAAFEKQFNINLPTTTLPGDDQWALNNINIPAVWEPSGSFSGATGSGTTVAVIDTGIDYSHNEFKDRIVEGYDFVNNDNIAEDLNNHGTHVAAIIAGENDGFGITGAAYGANIMPVKVLGADGTGYTSDIIAGINFAASRNVDVINLSLGGGVNSQAMQNAIANASNLGVTVVMAAGNNGGASPANPASNAANYGLAVGAVNQSGNLTGFSNRSGPSINYVTAPGEGIKSAIAGNDGYSYETYSGTSMATPFVAGLAALLIDYDTSLTPDQIVSLLTSTAENSTSSGTSQNANNYDGITNARSLITLETLNDFTNDDLTNPLIGIFGGDATSRKQNASKITSQQGSALSDFDYFEVLDPLTNNFASLAFDSDAESDRLSTLNELLSSNYFESFEIDQKWSIA